MLNLSYERLIEIIKQKSALSEDEIKKKVDDKIAQLSDLVSKEGAAHIVANQLGISLMDVDKKLKVRELKAGMKNVEIVAKIIKKFEIREFVSGERHGKVASLFIGDETGTIRATLWGDMANTSSQVKEGDIIKIKNAYTKLNNNVPEIHLTDKSVFIINPEGESISEIKNRFDRKYLSEAKEGEQVEIVGTVVQLFEPRFFELCPDCMKRARQKEGGFFCEIHGKVENPKQSYIFNLVLDDGTDNMRVVLYKQQAERFFSKSEEEIISVKGDLQKLEALKSKVFGNTVKICGRIQNNQLFDRQELISQLVFPEVNVEEEIKVVEEALAAQSS